MEEIKYFYKKAIYSARKCKFHYRSWKQLMIIVLLNITCLVLNGHSLDKYID